MSKMLGLLCEGQTQTRYNQWNIDKKLPHTELKVDITKQNSPPQLQTENPVSCQE